MLFGQLKSSPQKQATFTLKIFPMDITAKLIGKLVELLLTQAATAHRYRVEATVVTAAI